MSYYSNISFTELELGEVPYYTVVPQELWYVVVYFPSEVKVVSQSQCGIWEYCTAIGSVHAIVLDYLFLYATLRR